MTPTPNRGYFSGPEGKVNAATWGVIGLVALVIVWIMGGRIGDYLVEAADNTLHLVIVIGALLLIVAALVDPKKRAWYVFRSIVRMMTSWFIELDPIGIRKSYVERLKAKQAKFVEAVGVVRGQLIGAQRDAKANQSEYQQHEALFKAARSAGDQRAQISNSRDMQRCDILAKQYAESIGNLSKMQSVVVRYQEICADEIADKESDIRFREKQLKLAKATRGISGAIRGVLQGLPEKDMYDEAGNVLNDIYDQTLGEFDNVLDMTKDILSNANLSDAAALQSALDKFENTNTGAIVGKITKAEVMKQIAGEAIIGPPPAQASSSSDYSSLIQ